MENKILGYVDGRLKESERLEVEKHLATCAACRLRVNEFRAVSSLLDELPVIEQAHLIRSMVERVDYDGAQGKLALTLDPAGLVAVLEEQNQREEDSK